MQQILIMGILALVILIGSITYLGLAGVAVIYCLGGNDSPRNRRIFFGILGVLMIYALCACAYTWQSTGGRYDTPKRFSCSFAPIGQIANYKRRKANIYRVPGTYRSQSAD